MTDHISNKKYAIGLDIGGTKTLAALVDEEGQVINSILFPTQSGQGLDHFLMHTRKAIAALKNEALARNGELLGIGIASAGIIDSEEVKIVYAANLGWRSFPIGDYLTDDLGLPVKLGNDANLAAVAEYVWGTSKKVQDLIYITISTGVGAGIISSGNLVKGTSDSAGEFGHISTNPTGPRCNCGNFGCLENYSSGTAIAAKANELLIHQRNDWTTREVIEAAEAGDMDAFNIIKFAGEHLGYGITTMIHLFNPKTIVMGGGVMASGNLLLNEAKKTIIERCLPNMREHTSIYQTRLGAEIGVLGAAGLFFMDQSYN